MFIKCVGFKVNCLRKKVCVPFLATDAVHFKKSANAGKAMEKNTSSNDTAWCGRSMQNHTAFAICRVVYANWFVTAREGFLVHSQQCYLHQSHTHTHTRLTALCLGLPRWADTRMKGKTNLDFTEARDSEWQWHQLEHMQVCTSLQTDNHTSTPPLSFLQAGCPPCHPTNSVKALKAQSVTTSKIQYTMSLYE